MQEAFKRPWLNWRKILPSLIYAIERIPYYQQIGYGDLRELYYSLPVVTKSKLEGMKSNFSNPVLGSAVRMYTSGYMSGLKTEVEKSAEEITFLSRYCSQAPLSDRWQNIYLRYGPSGDCLPLLDGLHVVNLLEDPRPPEGLFASLERAVQGKKTRLLGLESQVKLFAYAYLHFKPKINFVEIVVGGDVLTPRVRQVLLDIPGTTVLNRYGITEIFGGATECLRCGCFHFDDYVIYDICDEYYSQNGSLIGKLLLSASYPFNQKTFVMKYLTGDIVELRFCEACSKYGVKLLGRTKSLLADSAGKIVLSSYDLYSKLDDFQEIARSSLFGNNRFGVSGHLLGHLRYQQHLIDNRIVLDICISDKLGSSERATIETFKEVAAQCILSDKYDLTINLHHEDAPIGPFMPDEVE